MPVTRLFSRGTCFQTLFLKSQQKTSMCRLFPFLGELSPFCTEIHVLSSAFSSFSLDLILSPVRRALCMVVRHHRFPTNECAHSSPCPRHSFLLLISFFRTLSLLRASYFVSFASSGFSLPLSGCVASLASPPPGPPPLLCAPPPPLPSLSSVISVSFPIENIWYDGSQG